MTRQVIPSMLLSVLIVCFFSVLLYQPERKSPAGQVANPSTRPEVGPSAPPASPKPKPTDEPTPASPNGAATVTTEPAAKAESAPAEGAGAHPAPSHPAAGEAKPEPVHAEAAPRQAEPAPTTVSKPPSTPSGPPSAFTTVKEGESLEDVSIRVYGSSDRVEVVWKANRDLLPRRDSPLPAGSVLRTPSE